MRTGALGALGAVSGVVRFRVPVWVPEYDCVLITSLGTCSGSPEAIAEWVYTRSIHHT